MCSKGCLRGRCVRPEVCECYFGWTSANCSVKCQCNGHGQCANETLLDVCHDCRNHTVVSVCHALVSAVSCVTYALRCVFCHDLVADCEGIRFLRFFATTLWCGNEDKVSWGSLCVSVTPRTMSVGVWSPIPNSSKIRDQTKSDPLVLQVGGFGARQTTQSSKKLNVTEKNRSFAPTGAHDPAIGRCRALVFALIGFVTQRSTLFEVLCLSRAAFCKVLRDAWRISRRVLCERFPSRKVLSDDQKNALRILVF